LTAGDADSEVTLSVLGSASLGIVIGPIQGIVAIYAGLRLDKGTPSFFLLARGLVSIAGLVTVVMEQSLEASFRGGHLQGDGTVSFSVKIGWFCTLSVSGHAHVQIGHWYPPDPSGTPTELVRLASVAPLNAAELPPGDGDAIVPAAIWYERAKCWVALFEI
jgi:hypothetical protein